MFHFIEKFRQWWKNFIHPPYIRPFHKQYLYVEKQMEKIGGKMTSNDEDRMIRHLMRWHGVSEERAAMITYDVLHTYEPKP